MALKLKPEVATRGGSINAGHTVVYRGREYRLRMLPSAWVSKDTRLLIGPGANVKPDILLREIRETGSEGRVGVDAHASIIEDRHIEIDRTDEFLRKEIGTTGSGVGPAVAERALRKAKIAEEVDELRELITDVPIEVNSALEMGRTVLVEGTQGFFLSLYHGTYPYVTSRDTSASGVCSEIGIGPKAVDEVVLVLKAYMTRVGRGPLPGEISEEEAKRRGWLEYGTVTGRIRRVAPFNIELAKRAAIINSATKIALTKIDAIFPQAKGKRRYEELPREAKKFIENIEEKIGIPVVLIGTGPGERDIIDLYTHY